jgi:hypothetical protein
MKRISATLFIISTIFWFGLAPKSSDNLISDTYPPPTTPTSPQADHFLFLPYVIMTPPSISRYIKASGDPPILDTQGFYNMGYYSYTQQIGIVIFHFGQPCSFSNGGVTYYGASAYKPGCRTTSEIKAAIQEFIHGYCNRTICGTQSLNPRLTIAISTSNCSNGGDQCTNPGDQTNVTFAHGQAWSLLIDDIIQYTTNHGYSYQVFVIGALDAELNWNYSTNTKAWVDGYKQNSYNHLYNIGACDGCPLYYTPYPLLPYDWSYEDIWYISFGGAATFYPLPEIYRTNWTNAKQWQAVSYYAATVKSNKLIFKGVLTQHQACLDTDYEDCLSQGTDNTNADATNQLWTTLNQVTTTSISSLVFRTDISWQQP